jgi:hypothetical protein
MTNPMRKDKNTKPPKARVSAFEFLTLATVAEFGFRYSEPQFTGAGETYNR